MTRIVYIITGLNMGGAERILLKISTALDTYKITVISLSGNGSLADDFKKKGIEVHLFDFKFNNLLSQFLLLVKVIKSINPDLVQTWLYHADLIGGLAAKLAGIQRILWSVRSTEINSSYSTRFVRVLCQFLSSIVPIKIVYVAHRSMDKHINLGYDNTNGLVIQNGFAINTYVDISNTQIENFRKSLNVKKDEILIGCVGRFHDIKGQVILLKVAFELLEEYSNVKFLFVGRGFNYSNDGLPDLNEINLNSDRIILIEEVDDTRIIFNSIDIFCLPSLSEGFPNVLGEAMLAGKYSVATDVGDVSFLLGNLIPLVIPGDKKDLKNKLESSIKMNKFDREQVGSQLKQVIIEQHSIDRMISKYEELYSNLLKKH